MSKIVTSAKGEKVDFDLLTIKNTMAAIPITENVRKREKFINKKRRRGVKRKVDEMAQNKRLEDANFAASLSIDKMEAKKAEELSEVVAKPTQKRRKIGK